MKKLILLPSLFFGIIAQAQFQTVSFEHKYQNIDIAINENKTKSFINYKDVVKEKSEKENVLVEEEKTISKKHYKKIEEIQFEKQLIFMPLAKMIVTSEFGLRYHPVDKIYKEHNGIDLRANKSFVYAVLDGEVLDSGYTQNNGNYIIIKHQDFETAYLHLDSFYNIKSDKIFAGDIIGITGSTGKSTGEHLHFSVKENNRYIDPISFLNTLITTNNKLLDYGQQ